MMKLVKSPLCRTLLGLVPALGLLCASGCTPWQTASTLPGLESWKDERAIVKKAQNDPFPSPQQVGLK